METEAQTVVLPERLGSPDMTLGTDPRTGPRFAASLAAFEMDGHGEPSPVDATSPYAEQLAFCNEAEPGFEMLVGAPHGYLPEVCGEVGSTEAIADGNEIAPDVHPPAETNGSDTVKGACRGNDVIFRTGLREVYDASLRDLVGFAGSL